MSTDTTARSPQTAILPSGRWRVARSRSRVGFEVNRRGAGPLHGAFTAFDGELAVGAAGTAAHGFVRIDSIDTGNEERDEHLCAPSFFATERYPFMTFVATQVVPTAGGEWAIDGELTIRDVTRPLHLLARVEDVAGHDDRRRLHVGGELDRRDFALTWSRVIEMTGAVAMQVRLELDLDVEPETWCLHDAEAAPPS